MRAAQPLPLRARLAAALVKLAFGWLYASGLSQLVLKLNGLPATPLTQLPLILALLLLLALLTWSRYQLLASGGTALLAALLLWLSRSRWLPEEGWPELLEPWARRATWTVDFLLGYQQGTKAELAWLAGLLCLLIALLVYLGLVRFNLPGLAAVALIAAFLLGIQLDKGYVLAWAVPAAVALCAALARQQKKTYRMYRPTRQTLAARLMLQSVPFAALALSLALLLATLIPTSFFHSRAFEGFMDDLSGRISAIPNQQRELPSFSLQQAGYYPLVDRLGGPASLSDSPMLRVGGSAEAMLLRGSVSQIYDGRNWIQDPDRSYYRYDSPLWRSEQTEVFDLERPDVYTAGLTAAQFNRTVNVSWSPLRLPTRTLFIAGKPLRVSLAQPDPFIVYFRPSGQMFSKHWIQPEQAVLLTGRVLRTEQAGFASMVRQIQASLPPEERAVPPAVTERYLQLPDLPEYRPGGLPYEHALQLTAGIEDPYARVLVLRHDLMANNRYALDVTVPPRDQDFVSWFLQTGEGYCVYFATAMTLLSRLAGIPARYVEGYYVPPAEDGADRILTGEQAHAWTEVYLAGIGWISVDATPGTAATQPDPTPVVTPVISGPLTPAVTATPTPTPTVAPTGGPNPGPDDKDPDDPDASGQPFGALWFLLLLPALAIGLLIRVWLRNRLGHDAARLSRQVPDPARRGRFYWQELRLLLHEQGQTLRPDESPARFLSRQQIGATQTAESGLNALFYGPRPPTGLELAALAGLYDSLEADVRRKRGLLAWLVRLFKSRPA
jgi:transglutaminase-like putative cysteine protease